MGTFTILFFIFLLSVNEIAPSGVVIEPVFDKIEMDSPNQIEVGTFTDALWLHGKVTVAL